MKLKTMNYFKLLGILSLSVTSKPVLADLFKCNACPAGYKCDGVSKSPCPAGSYSYAGASSCISCPAGQYQDASAQSSCKACSGSSYSSGAGSTSCTSCGTGYTVNSNHTGCDAITCPAGQYLNSSGTACVKKCTGARGKNYYSTLTDNCSNNARYDTWRIPEGTADGYSFKTDDFCNMASTSNTGCPILYNCRGKTSYTVKYDSATNTMKVYSDRNKVVETIAAKDC